MSAVEDIIGPPFSKQRVHRIVLGQKPPCVPLTHHNLTNGNLDRIGHVSEGFAKIEDAGFDEGVTDIYISEKQRDEWLEAYYPNAMDENDLWGAVIHTVDELSDDVIVLTSESGHGSNRRCKYAAVIEW